MPELPEVETMRRGILAIVGSRITDVQRVACRRRPIAITPRIDRFRRHAVGCVVLDVGRVGKRVAVHLDSGDAIVLEPRMTGLVLVADPPTREHLRFRCALSGNIDRELLYWDRRGLGSVRLFSPNEFDSAFGAGKLGPDALSMTGELFRKHLGDSKRAVKVALLDQRAVAGIGNLYASEILHRAEVHPARLCNRITRAQWQAIADSTRAVLEAAIHYEGSTLGDGTYRNALNQEGGYQNHHRVYDKAGKPCRRCGNGSSIRRIVQAQRSTFYCPVCQKMRAASRHGEESHEGRILGDGPNAFGPASALSGLDYTTPINRSCVSSASAAGERSLSPTCSAPLYSVTPRRE